MAPATISTQEIVAKNKVLRNTYMLLGITLLFSALTAGAAMMAGIPYINPFITLVLFYGLLFAISKTQESGWGLVWTFALTGFMGASLGPIFTMVLQIPNGGQTIMTALGMTGLTFFGLSAYAITSKKDFSFLSGFLMVGFFVLLTGVIANLFLHLPMLSLAISAGFVLFSSAIILWQTGQIVNGGERNYISATVTLYVSIYNLFMSLLSILLAFTGDD